MSSILRIGIVGTGGMAQARAEAIAQNPQAQLTAVVSRSLDRAERFVSEHGGRAYAQLEELMEDPKVDAVIITTPNDSHPPIAKAALRAGKHTLVEYALAKTVQDGKEILDAWKSSQCILHTGHTMRFSGKQQVLQSVIDQMGDFHLADFEVLFGRKPRKWFPDPKRLGSVFVGAIIHFHDEQRQLFGDVDWVEGHLQQSLTDEGFVDWDVASMWIGFSSGGLGKITYGRGLTPPGWSARERYVFADGYIDVEDDSIVVRKGGKETRLEIPFIDTIKADTDAFIAEVLDGADQIVPPEEALMAVAIGEAAAKASELGQRIKPEI